jgi:NTE family protein
VRTRLGVEHLMASSAIPALFPSVRVEEPAEAAGWYVDGATRRRFPLAPAVELGADRIVVVGTGSLYPPENEPDLDLEAVDLGDGAATLLGAVMDDPLRHDLRRLAAINAQASDADMTPHLNRHREARGRAAYRPVPYAAVAPQRSDELSRVAMEVYRSNHGTLLHTLGDPDLQVVHRILGSDSPLQGELLSYLMFDPDFFAEAADLGRRDARRWLASDQGLWRSGPIDPLDATA